MYPLKEEQPILLLLRRSLDNLEFVYERRREPNVYEITQMINTFLAVVAHPKDQLLDKSVLSGMRVDSDKFESYAFPNLPQLPVSERPKDVSHAWGFLEALRNSLAHGNIELLNLAMVRALNLPEPLPHVDDEEIAGIKIWNISLSEQNRASSQNRQPNPNWISALTIFGMQNCLLAMENLCEDRDNWTEHARNAYPDREHARKPRDAWGDYSVGRS